MNLRDLQYLLALVDYSHFGKAAEACFVSQPALSMQIKKLEETLGVQLIERKNKSFLVTEIGKSIAEQARDIINRVEAMREIAKHAKDPYSGELRLGIIPTLAPYLLPHIVPGLSNVFPKLRTYLVEEQTNQLIALINQGKLDAALLALPLGEENDFNTLPLFEEEFMLAVPKEHTLAKRKSIKQTDLKDLTLLLLEEGHCMRDQALSFCHSANASEFKKFRATSLETLRHMVASNAGITLMPKLAYRSNDSVSYLPFSTPKPMRTIGLAWRPSSAKKILLHDLAAQIKELMAKLKLVKAINTQLLCGKNHYK